jgi:thiol-disulfide isomerase/thioredoxin
VNRFQAPRLAAAEKIETLELMTLTGEKATLQTAAGKKTIVYFFAPWCGVCKFSMDALDMFAGKENLQAIAVGLDYDSAAELKPFQEKMRAPVFAGNAELQRRFKIDRFPTVYILDGDGKVAHTMAGYTSRFGIWLRTKI